MLAARLRNRQRHLRKWARRAGVSCYRIYERDVPDWPLIVDWYDGEAVAWAYRRTKDETPEAVADYERAAAAAIADGLELDPAHVILKRRARQRGTAQYEKLDESGHARVVEEGGLRFEVNLRDYLDTGLFLDHRPTRALVRELAAGRRVLNLFGYTGSFTCHARAGGATSTVTVDMSRTYTRWTIRNFELNGFPRDDAHRVLCRDCLEFLPDARSRGDRYDLIVCDPPTFSNSKRMSADSFAVERDHPRLVRDCLALLAPGGILVFSTNARGFELAADAVPEPFRARDITEATIPPDFRNRRIHRCWRIAAPDAGPSPATPDPALAG